jgi:3'-5' exoribonuclease
MTYKLIKDMAVDEQLEQICMVAQVEAKTTKAGKPFVKVTIKDSSGSLPINIWQTNVADTDLKPGVFAVFKLKIEDFKGSKSATATPPMIVKAPDDMSPYQNQNGLTDAECNAYYQILLDAIKKVKNPYIKEYLDFAFNTSEEQKQKFCTAPASYSNRGAYKGGLVEHVAKVLMNAEFLIKTQSAGHIKADIDADIVIAGVLMHDYGKTSAYEIDANGMAKVTRQGMLLEHLPMSYAWSTLLFDRVENQILHKEVPQEIKDHIHHCILSHHGKLEHGSPVTPKSIEAQIVHMADMADSTTSNYAEPTKANASSVDSNGFIEGNRFSSKQLFIGTKHD